MANRTVLNIPINASTFGVRLIGLPELKADLQRLRTQDVPKAIKTAIRNTGRAAKPTVSKVVKEHYTYLAPRIKQGVFTRFAPDVVSVQLATRPPTVLAASFKGPSTSIKTRKANYISWSIIKGKRTKSKRGFMLPGRQGLLLPFHRTSQSGARYPIDVIHAPSLYNLFVSGQFADDMTDKATTILTERLSTETTRAIHQYGRIK